MDASKFLENVGWIYAACWVITLQMTIATLRGEDWQAFVSDVKWLLGIDARRQKGEKKDPDR